jgi:hypothetical protein
MDYRVYVLRGDGNASWPSAGLPRARRFEPTAHGDPGLPKYQETGPISREMGLERLPKNGASSGGR